MKIAQFTDTFLPQINGVATHIANISKEFGKRGHKVMIFSPDVSDIKRPGFEAENVTVIQLPSLPGGLVYPEAYLSVIGFPFVLKHLHLFQPDIIHIHTLITVGLDGVLAAKVLKRPLVSTWHVYMTTPEYIGWIKNKSGQKLMAKFILHYAKYFFHVADANIVPSKQLASDLNDIGFENSLRVIPNGVVRPKSLSDKEKRKLKRLYGLEKKVIIHFGRLSLEKKIDDVIRSFSNVADEMDDVSLFIIGDGPARKSLEKLVKKLGLEKKVVFSGFIAHQDLLSSGLLNVGDVFVTASTMENQPLAVLEAMAAGLPIVAVKEKGLPELVSDNGCLVEPDNINLFAQNILIILKDEKLWRKMSGSSRNIADKFSVDKTVNKLTVLYRKQLMKYA